MFKKKISLFLAIVALAHTLPIYPDGTEISNSTKAAVSTPATSESQTSTLSFFGTIKSTIGNWWRAIKTFFIGKSTEVAEPEKTPVTFDTQIQTITDLTMQKACKDACAGGRVDLATDTQCICTNDNPQIVCPTLCKSIRKKGGYMLR
ncbi:MAG TPA: hypothetical protein VJ201_07115 [Candidatus Babeliales bacterium]|nr:hypothetical protein [Candidatus Babeliales bacterium]